MPKAYLGLSTNQGNRQANLESAKESFNTTKESKIYETEPWGVKNQPWFLNQCIEIQTDLSTEDLLKTINTIETKLGRKKQKKWGPRSIDIDILYYNRQIIKNEKLTIPHHHLRERNFVLTPLAEIAPNFTDPMDNKTIQQLKSECQDISEVHPL